MGDSAHTTRHTNPGKIRTPPFFSKRRTFSKIGLRGTNSTAIPHCTTEADFRKMLPSSRKRRGADAFENNPSFIDKETVLHSNNIAILVQRYTSSTAVYTKFRSYLFALVIQQTRCVPGINAYIVFVAFTLTRAQRSCCT